MSTISRRHLDSLTLSLADNCAANDIMSLSCWGWPLNNVHDIEPQHPNKWFTGVWHCPMPETSFWVAAGMFGSKGHLAILFSWFLSEGYPLNLWVLGVGQCSLGLVSDFARCHFDSLWRCFKIWKEWSALECLTGVLHKTVSHQCHKKGSHVRLYRYHKCVP